MDLDMQNMAIVHHCRVVESEYRQDTEWDGGEVWPIFLRDACARPNATSRLTRAYALAQAHAGPSRVYCHRHSSFLSKYMRHRNNLAYGMHVLEDTLRFPRTYNTNSSSVMVLLKLLAEASEPGLRGIPYGNLIEYLEVVHDFNHEMIEESWYSKGIPDWLEFAGATPTTHHALVWVVRHSLSVLTLENFHRHTTKSADMAGCRKISSWFEEDKLFSAQGLTCVCASRSKPLNTAGIQSDLGRLPLEQVTLLADKEYLQECHGWAECSAAFFAWGVLLWWYGGGPLVLAFLCWRPDLLIFWRSRPAVHTPSYAGYVRQLKQQRFTARAAQQAAAKGSRSALPDSAKENYRAYAAHLFQQCWCLRARFVVASFTQLSLVSLFVSPVRLVVSVMCMGWKLLGGTAKELLAGTARAVSRICY